MIPNTFDPTRHFVFFEDFNKMDTVLFTSTDDSGTGTNLLNDQRGGWMSVVTAGADNDYHLMSTTKKLFEILAGKPLRFEARISLTEAATNAANVILGLTDTLTSGNLQDNGAGPASSHKGFVFYKKDGELLWKFETSNGTAKTTQTLGSVVSGNTVTLGFQVEIAPTNTQVKVVPFIDGVAKDPHFVTLSGLSTMYAVFGVKAGSASAETLKIDYLGVHQPR